MAQTSILSSISRTGTFPIRKTINAPNNCGTISLVLNQNWTEQMIHELPTINVAVYIDTDIKLLSIDIDMSTVTSDNIELKPVTPYSIPLFDLPTDFDFVVTPIFDEDALLSHNLQIDSGDIDVFNTSDNGIVDTNISSYINEYWTTKTDTFNLNMVFDNSNIASGGSGGGGGGGGQITVDTQVMQGSTNPVQNGAIYDFVNSSVATNTACFIGTFNSLSDLENYSGEVSNNDYAFVVSVDSDSNTVYNRYKYNSDTETWNFEYSLNNSSFTAAEWETIQSGLTANDRTNYNDHLTNTNNPHSVTKTQVGLGNVDNTSDADKPVSTATQTALNGKQNTLTFDGTYDASTNKAATVSTVTNAINDLDVSSVGGSGKYISAISETNGKISPTVETMDTTPTSDSKKAVTSGAVYTALGSKQDALTQSQLAAANSGITAAKLTADETALGEVINGGAAGTKNLAPISTIQKTTTTAHYTSIIPCYFKAGTYHIKFGYTTVQVATFVLRNKEGTTLLNLPANIPKGTGTYNANFTISEDCYGYHIYGENAVELTDIMICRKTLYDANPDYEPYAPAKTNVEITPALVEVVDSGAKNIADASKSVYDTRTLDGVTITRNNMEFTVSGTSGTATTSFFNIYIIGPSQFQSTGTIPAGDWVACIEGVGSGIDKMKLGYGHANGVIYADYGKPLHFHVTATEALENLIRISTKNSTSYNCTFELMICTAADWAISQAYQPYRPSWQEMTDNNKIIDISSQVTAESGYTVESTTHLYYQNKQVFGMIAVAINSGSYSPSLTAIAKLPVEYAPARQYLGSCGFSTDQWAITNIGYAFIQAANASSTAQRGQISVKSPTANLTHMILNVCYPVQIDGTF